MYFNCDYYEFQYINWDIPITQNTKYEKINIILCFKKNLVRLKKHKKITDNEDNAM